MKQIILKSATGKLVNSATNKIQTELNKQFVLNFTKQQTSSGAFKTSVQLIRVPKKAEERQRGILHKTVGLKNRVQGDVPSLTNYLNSLSSSGNRGIKVLQKSYKAVKTTSNAVVKTALFAENIALLTSDVINPNKKIQFTVTRVPTTNGKTKYHVDVDHIKRTGRHERGIIHKAVAHRREFKEHFKGDTFSLTKKLDSIQPKSVRGIIGVSTAKGTYNFVKVSGRLAENTAMGAENVALLANDSIVQHLDRKLRYETEFSSDTGKALVKTTGVIIKGVNGIRRYSAAKKNYKHEKGLLKQYKGEYQKTFDSLHNVTFKSKMIPWVEVYDRKDKIQLKQSKQQMKGYKKSVKQSGNTPVQKQRLNLRKKRVKAQIKEVHRNNLMLKMQKDRVTLQKRIVRKEKPVPLALQPGVHAVKSAASSGWNKAVSADSSNDVMKAIDKSVSLLKKGANAASAAQHASNQLQLKLYNKSITSEQKSMFKKKNPAFKQKKKNASLSKSLQKRWKKWKNPNAKNPYTSVGDFVKDVAKTIINSLRNSLKGAMAHLLAAVLPICFFVVCMILTLSMIIGIFQNTGFLYGSYNAKDSDLTSAAEYYVQLADNLNKNVLKCGDKSTWRAGLTGTGTSAYNPLKFPENPIVYKYGRDDANLAYDAAGYDFDPYILWSFLCAYNYDFEASEKAKKDNKNYDPEYWKCNNKTKKAIKQLFDSEYHFKYNYVKAQYTHRDWYIYEPDCYAWKTDDAPIYKNSFSINAVPDEVRKFADSRNYLHFDDNFELLNYEDPHYPKKTGWYILLENQTVKDNYKRKMSGVYYCHDGEDPNKFYYKDSDGYEQGRTSWWWQPDETNQIWFAVQKKDTQNITGRTDVVLIKLYKQYDCTEETTLYYVVKQTGTLKENAETILRVMTHGDERVDYFNGLIGNDTDKYYGNHQLFSNPVYPDKDIHQLIDEEKVCTNNGRNMVEWNKSSPDDNHSGIDILCDSGTKVRSVIDGTITNIDTSNHTVEITTESDYEFWYDDNNNAVIVTFGNVQVKSGLKKGDTVKKNDIIGTVTDYKKCAGYDYFTAKQPYIHIDIQVGRKKKSFVHIDPLLSFY